MTAPIRNEPPPEATSKMSPSEQARDVPAHLRENADVGKRENAGTSKNIPTEPPKSSRPSTEPKKLGRMRALDGLRFVAAVGVMLYHFTAARGVVWSQDPKDVFPEFAPWTAYGALGPELFFIISGFVILMTAWGRSARYYVASRVSRIFPGYWVAVLLTGLLLLEVWPGGKNISVGQWLLNFTMVQDIFGVGHIDSVYWTLWVELRFYILIFILLLIGITRKSVIAFTVIVPTLGIAATFTGHDTISMLLIGPYSAFFMVGMLMYLIRRDGGTWLTWALLIANLAAGTVIRVRRHVIMLPDRLGWEPSIPLLVGLIILCAVTVWIVTSPRLAGISWKWLTTLGALTYPLYLIHQHWGWWFISLVRDQMAPILAVSLAIILSLALATAIYQFVEKPIGPRMRAWLGGKKPKKEGAAVQ